MADSLPPLPPSGMQKPGPTPKGVGGGKFVALPIKFASLIPKGLAHAAHPLVVATLGGAGYAVAKVGNCFFKVVRAGAGIAERGEVMSTAKATATSVTGLSFQQAEKKREAAGAAVQTTTSVGKGVLQAAQVIPGVGTVKAIGEAAFEIVAWAEEKERGIGKANITQAKWSTWVIIETIRAWAPLMFKGVGKLAAGGEYLTERLAARSYQNWSKPSGVSDALQDIGDWMDARAFTLMHLGEQWLPPEKPQVTPAQAIVPQEVTPSDIEEFEQLSEMGQQDWFFLLLDSDAITLSDEQKEVIRQFKEEGTITEEFEKIIGLFKALPEQETQKLTPSRFEALDELTKLQLFRLVRDQAQNLTADEREFLFKERFERLVNRGDWQQLRAKDKRPLTALLLHHFNRLSTKHKEELYSLSPEQLQELSFEAKKELIKIVAKKLDIPYPPPPSTPPGFYEKVSTVAANVGERVFLSAYEITQKPLKFGAFTAASVGTGMIMALAPEAVVFASLAGAAGLVISEYKKAKEPPRINLDDDKQLLEHFNSQFNAVEKFRIYSQLGSQFLLFTATEQEVSQLIEEKKRELATYDPQSQKAKELSEFIYCLEEESTPYELAVPKPPEASQKLEVKTRASIPSKEPAEEPASLNMTHVYQTIGPDVGSGKRLKEPFYFLGILPRLVASDAGSLSWLLFKTLGYVSEPYIPEGSRLATLCKPLLSQESSSIKWIEPVIGLSARAVELSLLFRYTEQVLISYLQNLGLPIAEIDRFLNTLPAHLMEKTLALLHLSLSGFKGAIKTVDAFSGRLLDLNRQVKITKWTGVQENIGRWTEYTKSYSEVFEKAVVTTCKSAESARSFMCTEAVFEWISVPKMWPELAKILKVPVGSDEFFKTLRSMMETGTLPEALMGIPPPKVPTVVLGVQIPELSAVVQAPAEVLMSVIEMASSAGEAMQESVASNLFAIWNLIADTSVGKTLYHVGEAVKTAPYVQETVEGVTQTVAKTAQTVGETVGGAVASGVDIVKHATGLKQRLSPEVERTFKAFVTLQANLAKANTDLETYRMACATIDQINALWWGLGSYAVKVAGSEVVETSAEFYTKTIFPILQNYAKGFESLYHASMASKEYLQGQLELPDMTQMLQNDLKQMGKDAFEAMNVDVSRSEKVASALSYVGSGMELGVGLASCGTFMVTTILRHVLPHLLRSVGPKIGENAKPFWYGCALSSWNALDATGKQAQEACQNFGEWFQKAFNRVLARTAGYVDPERIRNFKDKLESYEQKHLIALASTSSHIKPEERTTLRNLEKKFPKLDAREYDTLARITLQVFDRLSVQERLQHSSASFDTLDDATKKRIIFTTRKYALLTKEEMQNPEAIVTKFNRLTSEQKAEINHMPIWEYAALSKDEQEDIRFRIAHCKTGKEKLGKKGFQAFFEIEKMSSQQMSELLLLLPTMPMNEQFILTPSELRKMGPAKVKQCLDLVKNYRRDLIEELYKTTKGTVDLKQLGKLLDTPAKDIATVKKKEQLLIALASLFQELRPSQQAEINHMVPGEVQELPAEDQRILIQYLMEKRGLEQKLGLLKQQLVLVQQKKPIDAELIADSFNLLTLEEQVAYRQEHEIESSERESFQKGVQQAVEKLEKQINVLPERMARLKKEYMGIQFQRDLLLQEKQKKEKELESINAQLDRTARVIQEMQERQSTLQAELVALRRILGKGLPTFDELEDEPPTPARRLVLDANLKLAVSIHTSLLQNSFLGPLKEFKGSGLEFDKEVKRREKDIQGFISSAQKKLDEIPGMIAQFRKERQKEGVLLEDQIKKEMEINLLRTYYTPLFKEILKCNQKFLEDFLQEAQKIRKTKLQFEAL
jgi:hypothetical protein